MIYNRFFYLTKKDKEVIESFIDILYFWGPDYDSEIEKINFINFFRDFKNGLLKDII